MKPYLLHVNFIISTILFYLSGGFFFAQNLATSAFSVTQWLSENTMKLSKKCFLDSDIHQVVIIAA